ncbi:muramidase family protein [Anaerosalibacter sp. Marseille-P3206]|uniref:muramidase family protein n=1 Tax=Anaerosalibacter sp. Marseille-P3206 TaxID=1871005 RepID=UPI001F4323E9|nr:LysM peptidoglycan-binding domain-containing protein [Anaerosalibacter sp. Marseille-P3206]
MNYYRSQKYCPVGSFPYTIKSGDTLYLLAQRYNTTVEAIMAINPGIDPYNLQIGQVICIPSVSPQPLPPCPNGFYYTIKSGDTFYKLSIQFNVPLEAILRANPGVDPYNLQIGQVVCIPRAQPVPPTPPVPPCPGGFYYTVRAGDTLYSIGLMYNVTVQQLIAANPGIDPNNLQIGQIICIPMQKPVPPCPGGFYYTIKAGDTLYSIARMFNITVQEIIAANPGIDPNNLQIGQIICIPRIQPIPPCPGGFYYRIKPGDTLYKIGQMYNVTVQQLIKANPGIDPNNLQVGQIICIPKSMPCSESLDEEEE